MQDVLVKIESLQRPWGAFCEGPGGQPELIEVMAYGRFSKRGNKYTLKYDEVDGNKDFVCATKLEFEQKADKKAVKITKSGKTSTMLIVQENECTNSWYNTEYGGMRVGVWGESIKAELGKNGGTLELGYRVDINAMATSINYVKISISKKAEEREAEDA